MLHCLQGILSLIVCSIVVSIYLNDNRLQSDLQETKTKLEEDYRIEKERYI